MGFWVNLDGIEFDLHECSVKIERFEWYFGSLQKQSGKTFSAK